MSFTRLVFIFHALCLSLAACSQAPEPSTIKRILFVGNSYTFQHQVPKQVAGRLSKLHGPDVAYVATMVADGGQNLIKYVDDPRILKAFEANAFDYIVLQDQSTATFYAVDHQDFFKAVRWFKTKATAEGAEIILYQTWPRRDGHDFYSQRPRRGFTPPSTPQEMRVRLEKTYQQAAQASGAQVAPVGNCWMQRGNHAALYQRDGSHATREGAALAANVIAQTIAGHADPCAT